jgi:hypothetical protein
MEIKTDFKEKIISILSIKNLYNNIVLYQEVLESRKLKIKSFLEYLKKHEECELTYEELIESLKKISYFKLDLKGGSFIDENWFEIKNVIKINEVSLEEFMELENYLKKTDIKVLIKKKTFLPLENACIIEFNFCNDLISKVNSVLEILDKKSVNFVLKKKEVLSVSPKDYFFNEYLKSKNMSTGSNSLSEISHEKMKFPLLESCKKISTNFIMKFFIENIDEIKRPIFLTNKYIADLPIINKQGDFSLESLEPKLYHRKGFHKFSMNNYRKNSFQKPSHRKFSHNF